MHVPGNRVRKGRIKKAIKIDAAVCLPRSERCGRKNGRRLLLVIVMPVFSGGLRSGLGAPLPSYFRAETAKSIQT
ncbi:conserved hypothetical protein [Neisseria gonorrhoeae PID18]|nr:conserved hypothetical protein [Neisseria gonorrhoeae PID18]